MNYSPIAARLILVSKKFTSSLPENETYFGVTQNKSSRYELGSNLTFHSEGTLFENVNYKQDLKLFSNYLEDPSNIDLDYLAQIEIDVNPLLSTQLIFQLIYDDNAIARLQVREVFGVGVQLKIKLGLDKLNILIISYYWPPSGGSGGSKVDVFCKISKKLKCNPIVLTVDPNLLHII